MAFLTGARGECERDVVKFQRRLEPMKNILAFQSALERHLLVNRYYIPGGILGENNTRDWSAEPGPMAVALGMRKGI